MTAKFCKKCVNYSATCGVCLITEDKVTQWTDACDNYQLRSDLEFENMIGEV